MNGESDTCYLIGAADGRKNELAYEQVFKYTSDNAEHNRWTELLEMKEGVQSAGFELLGEEQDFLAVFGGIKTHNEPTPDIHILAMSKNRWMKCSISLPFAGRCHAFVLNKKRDNALVHGYSKEIEKRHNLNVSDVLKEIAYKERMRWLKMVT